jgi:hypothetical protein
MKKMGKDLNAAPLYTLATGREQTLKSTGDLSDPQIARMAYYYVDNNASVIEQALGRRTQLTEHLSKFTTISNVSELGRSLEATGESGEENLPYDATILVKKGLKEIAEGKITLKEFYYAGQGGQDSIFLGAPSEKESGISGAEQLRSPFKHSRALKRQMDIFPDNKREFKKELNALKTNSKTSFSKITEEEEREIENSRINEQVEEADKILNEIKEIEPPSTVFEVGDFLRDRRGPIKHYTTLINKKNKQFSGNSEAISKLVKAIKALMSKKKETSKKKF